MWGSWYQRWYRADLAEDVGHQRLARSVGQSDEHAVDPVEQSEVPRLEHQVGIRRGETRVQVGCRGAGLAVAGGEGDVQSRVLGADAQQLGAGEARRSDDADPGGVTCHGTTLAHSHARRRILLHPFPFCSADHNRQVVIRRTERG